MDIRHRKIMLPEDKEYVLERHCRVNYECDTPWKRKMTYDAYRQEWFGMAEQRSEFLDALTDSRKDSRTIADIFYEQNDIIGYLWVPFHASETGDFAFADIQDIYVEPPYRNKGIASYLFAYAEENARKNGATVIRSGTGCENTPSFQLHAKLGYYQYRFEFEKLL